MGVGKWELWYGIYILISFFVGVYLFICFCPTVQCLLISELVAGKKNLIVERDLAEGVSIK